MQSEYHPEFTQDDTAPEAEPETQAVADMARRLNAITERDERQRRLGRRYFLVGCVMFAMGFLGGE